MTRQFIKAQIDIHCKYKGNDSPSYRVFVNDELFVERTWIWPGYYLSEMLQIEAEPGKYCVRIEAVQPVGGKFKTRNHRVEYGSAQWIDEQTLEILP